MIALLATTNRRDMSVAQRAIVDVGKGSPFDFADYSVLRCYELVKQTTRDRF